MNQYYNQATRQDLGYAYNQTRVLGNDPSLTNPQDGFIKGNMFKNLYNPYKNYQPQALTANNDQEALFLRMAEVEFAAHDLNLYLDLHPQDGNMIDLFNQYRMESNQLLVEYEKKYGPINISSDSLNQSPFLWQTLTFPWNEGGL